MATVLIDPERVVLYQDGLQEAQVEEIRAACARCLPVVPAVALSDFERDYERGLADLAARQAG